MYRTKKKLALNELTRIKFWATVKYNEADVALALCSSEQRGKQTKSADCGIELALQWWEVNVVITAPMLAIRELKQQTFLSSRTSDCRGGLDRQRRFWREILMLSKTRSPTQTALFCLYFLTGILER